MTQNGILLCASAMFHSAGHPLFTFSPTLASMKAKLPGSFLSSPPCPLLPKNTLLHVALWIWAIARLLLLILRSRDSSLWSHTHPWLQLWSIYSTQISSWKTSVTSLQIILFPISYFLLIPLSFNCFNDISKMLIYLKAFYAFTSIRVIISS